VWLDQPPARGEPQREAAERARGDAADEPVADLLEHQLGRGVRRRRPRVRLGEGDRDEEQRHAQTVVEPALDVEPLADPGGDALVGHDRLAERRVGAREHDREHHGLREADPRHDRRADQRTGDDGER
jgi:hypothetical protein